MVESSARREAERAGDRFRADSCGPWRVVFTGGEKSVASHLQKIRADGFDHSASSQVVGITDIGVPVFDSGGAILAVMTVSSFRMKGDLKEERSLVPILQACARRIADRL